LEESNDIDDDEDGGRESEEAFVTFTILNEMLFKSISSMLAFETSAFSSCYFF